MPFVPVGLQLYSLHRILNEENLEQLLSEVKAAGYEGVEGFGDLVHDARDYRAAVEKAGLTLMGWHTPMDRLTEKYIDSTIAYFEVLGVKSVVVPWLSNPDDLSEASLKATWDGYAKDMNAAVAKLKAHGMTLGYHNHSHEFTATIGGKPVLEYFMNALSPEIFIQLDTGNALNGNGDIIAFMNAAGNRIHQVHIKPYSRTKGYDAIINEGDDMHDWDKVHSLAKAAGTKQYIIEYESAEFPAIEAVTRCLNGLKATMK